MARRQPGSIRALQEAVDQIPGFLETMTASARAVLKAKAEGEALYQQAHWGRRGGSPPRISSVADPSQGVIELGRLQRVVYLTRKGNERRAALYGHEFERTNRPEDWPILAFATNGSGLVIVRDRSDYTVTERGIEG